MTQSTEDWQTTAALIGPRAERAPDPIRVINESTELLKELRTPNRSAGGTFAELKGRYASACRTYFTAAAVSRRRVLAEEVRTQLSDLLFGLRAALERRIVDEMSATAFDEHFLREATKKSFFGVSAKQGVSIRYPLVSCVPTRLCGGRCYAHDGRDREIHHIFRGAINLYLGANFEEGTTEARAVIMDALGSAISHGIRAARADAAMAAKAGYHREPRIRFSHVGEMASTPDFTNSLARRIRELDPDMACVIYTRHPSARKLDPSLLRVNFTVEGSSDSRLRHAPSWARLVNVAWDGKLLPDAATNFLEHHGPNHSPPRGEGHVCPVSASEGAIQSCDAARCDLCFTPTVVRSKAFGADKRRILDVSVGKSYDPNRAVPN